MIVCVVALLLAHYVDRAAAIGLLIVGALALVSVEMLASMGEWIASMELAPAEHRGSYLSVYSLGNSLQDAIAPTVITSVLLLGAAWLWPILGALACTGMMISATLARSGTTPDNPGAVVAGAD